MRRVLIYGLIAAGALGLVLGAGCRNQMNQNQHSASLPQRDINAVLADHADRLMAIPGVVGVYVGLLNDGKTPCLKVMLGKKDQALERAIPRTIEGHPVVTEVTGEIRPMNPRPK